MNQNYTHLIIQYYTPTPCTCQNTNDYLTDTNENCAEMESLAVPDVTAQMSQPRHFSSS